MIEYAAAASFFLGALPFGWMIARLWGVQDLRAVGSSNVGATNVVRTAGWLPGALTFVLDFCKAFVPTVYFSQLAPDSIKVWAAPYAVVFGTLAVLGHCYSPFLRFRGGKGVSSMLGLAMGASPTLGSACVAAYVIFALLSKTSALGSLSAVFVFFFGALFFNGSGHGEGAFKLCAIVVALVVVHRHEKNWKELLSIGALALVLVAATSQVHAAGELDFRNKELPNNSHRIVALMPAIAETIEDLGEGGRLLGAPSHSKLKSADVKDLGPYTSISAESVIQLKPDVVIASFDGNIPSLVDQLERVKIRVVTINTQTLTEIVRSTRIIATIIGQSQNPKLGELEAAIKPRPTAKPHRVFLQIGWNPLISVGPQTFVHELLEAAGGKNVIEKSVTKYPVINPEEVVSRNPQTILVAKLTNDASADLQAQKAKDYWQRFKDVDAVKNSRVYIIEGDNILKPGFRLVEGVKKLRQILAEAK